MTEIVLKISLRLFYTQWRFVHLIIPFLQFLQFLTKLTFPPTRSATMEKLLKKS
jgi:hypothetical protein